MFGSLENNKHYTFYVEAVNSYGTYRASVRSGYFIDKEMETPVVHEYPANPPRLSVRVSGTYAKVSWSRVTHANQYQVGIGSQWGGKITTGTSYILIGLNRGQTYTVYVEAINAVGGPNATSGSRYRKSASITFKV